MATTTIINAIIQTTRIIEAEMEKIYTRPIVETRIIDSKAKLATSSTRLTEKSPSNLSYPYKQRECRICGLSGYTEWHHIISRGHAKKTNQLDLIDNPGNVVELCKSCHDQTTASKSRYLLEKKEKKWNKRFWRSHQ
tara:strand:+ start:1297 stop:1707 length:411 start_codon:yes stop_codon:yes gene_type:complete